MLASNHIGNVNVAKVIASPEMTDHESLSLDSLLIELNQWRQNKSSPKDTIPNKIWMKVFKLTELHPPSAVRSLLGISDKQFKRKREALLAVEPPAKDKLAEFCTVVNKPYQPQSLPSTEGNVIVEFVRADGMVLKIHTVASAELFSQLAQPFLAGNL